MGQSNARISDAVLRLQAGIKPTKDEIMHDLYLGPKKPTRVSDQKQYEALKADIRIIDEQNATNRFKWYNLPTNITGYELERFLYYKGQLCFYYDPDLDQFFFMPYALDGTIDFYGRFNTIHPVPMSNGTTDMPDSKAIAIQADVLANKKLKVLYGTPTKPVDPTTCAILLHDHCKQRSETIIPRQQLNDHLCGLEAELLCYMKTNALAGAGVRGLRVSNDDEKEEVLIGNKSVKDSALNGEIWTPMLGNVEFQELMGDGQAKMTDYFEAMQAVDNLRLSTYGLGEGQLFEKKAHMLQTEADQNQSNVGIVLSSDLAIRQNFCIIANSIWGLGIWCEPNEAYAGEDLNGDGNDYSSDTDGSQSSVETKGE